MVRTIEPSRPGSALRVLCLEDVPVDAELIHEQLVEAGFAATMDVVSDKDGFLAALGARPYDLVLADHTLPGYDAFSAVEDTSRLAPGTPVIIVSGTIGEDTAVELLKQGAADYVFKDRLARLGFAAARALETARFEREMREAEAALGRSRRLLESVMAATTDLIVVKDSHGRFVLVNRAVERLTGLSAHELIGKDDYVLFPPETAASLIERDREALSSEAPSTTEEIVRTRDGRSHTLLTVRGPLRDPEGRVYGVFRVSHDITERQMMEARLRQTQKMEALGQLASGVAHDFNNMLGVIVGYTDLMLSRLRPDDELRADLLTVLDAAERSSALIRQLLAFSREQDSSPEVVDINTEIRANLKMLTRIIGENIQMVFEEGEGVWPVALDRVQFSQVLANLSSNARDAITGQGRITLTTRNVSSPDGLPLVQPSVPPGDYVLVEFRDDGEGMDASVRQRIFDPFFTTKKPGKGTGLGLSTVYGIVKQHCGHIEVESEVGRGSTFYIYFPRARPQVVTEVSPSRVEIPRGKETVLLVEDEPQVLNLTRTMLERLGYRVISCETPSEALQAASEAEPVVDLLITDLVMPEMDGGALARRVAESNPSMKTLYVSGHPREMMDHLGVADHQAEFLQKPFSLESLARAVRRALDKPAGEL